MLKLSNLNVVFGTGGARNHAVKDVSLEIEKGKSFGLIGESGCGKSTVLNCITGLLGSWTGEMRIDGRSQQIRRELSFYRKLQMVFQDPYRIAASQAYHRPDINGAGGHSRTGRCRPAR